MKWFCFICTKLVHRLSFANSAMNQGYQAEQGITGSKSKSFLSKFDNKLNLVYRTFRLGHQNSCSTDVAFVESTSHNMYGNLVLSMNPNIDILELNNMSGRSWQEFTCCCENINAELKKTDKK